MPFRALVERIFNQSIYYDVAAHDRIATFKEPLLPLGTKNRLGPSFDF